MKYFLLGLVFMCWLPIAWADWPSLPYPENAKVESIGKEVRLNGVPMRMQRVLSGQSSQNLLNFYKQALGAKHVETEFLGGRLLSQGRGDYLITVRVNTLSPTVTEVLLSISDMRSAKRNTGLPLGYMLPANSMMLSDMESVDRGRNSRQIILKNRHSIDTNANFFINTLQHKGYQLQTNYINNTPNAKTFMFEGDSREAQLVIVNEKQISNIVLTTIQTTD
jgi:hypothetical protein